MYDLPANPTVNQEVTLPSGTILSWDGSVWIVKRQITIQDALTDGAAYGRRNAAWVKIPFRQFDVAPTGNVVNLGDIPVDPDSHYEIKGTYFGNSLIPFLRTKRVGQSGYDGSASNYVWQRNYQDGVGSNLTNAPTGADAVPLLSANGPWGVNFQLFLYTGTSTTQASGSIIMDGVATDGNAFMMRSSFGSAFASGLQSVLFFGSTGTFTNATRLTVIKVR